MDNIKKFLELTSPDGGNTYSVWATTLYIAMTDLESKQRMIEKSFEDFKSNWRAQQKGIFLELHTEEHRKEKGLTFSGWRLYLDIIAVFIAVASLVVTLVFHFAKP
jgi:hypothetical protein